jgi:HlyD family secretion protein
MTAPTQEPAASAPQQAAVQQAAKNALSTSAPAPSTGAAHRRGKLKAWLVVVALLIVVAGLGFAWAKYTGKDLGATLVAAWHKLMGTDVPEGFVMTNGRAEATKAYISTKYQARIESVLVREGDTVEPGQVLVQMDTRTLKARLRQAEAQIQKAKDAKATGEAVVAQREAELAFWKSEVARERKLIETGATGREAYEAILAKGGSANAALAAARSQVTEASAAIAAAVEEAEQLRIEIKDGILVAMRRGRIQYRLAEPGEVLPPGGRVLDMVDLTDVYMLFYLPEAEAGKVIIGTDVRLIFDALPSAVIPATLYFVESEAQFTPKSVETRTERQKLAFQARARIDPALLRKYEPIVKIGVPGVVYVRVDPSAQWPERLQVKLPDLPELKAPKQ